MTDVRTTSRTRGARSPGMFRNARTIFSVRGVPVRVDRSYWIVAGLVAYLFYRRYDVPLADFGEPLLLLSAVVVSALFFLSILGHELGHAWTSLDRDVPVAGITMFAMGGVTESTREAASARHEFVIVGIGPFISLVIGGAFGLLVVATGGVQPFEAVFGYLAWFNVALAVFNVLPGYPLDGGRLLRSVLWGATGRRHAATRWAARVGQAFALALMGLGLWLFVGQGGGGFGGLWEVFIGFFLLRGATDSHKRARLEERLATRTARDVMGSVPPVLAPHQTLAEAIEQVQQRPSLLWPVGDPLTGGLRLGDIDGVAADRWATTRVDAVALPAAEVSVDADLAMDQVLARLAAARGAMLIVTAHGRPVGLLTASLVGDIAG